MEQINKYKNENESLKKDLDMLKAILAKRIKGSEESKQRVSTRNVRMFHHGSKIAFEEITEVLKTLTKKYE